MVNEVILDDFSLKVTDFEQGVSTNSSGKKAKTIRFDFEVRGGNEYHDVTVHLYKNTFDVKIPELDLSFRGTINNYSTSRTDFTDENSSSLFSLELIEIG